MKWNWGTKLLVAMILFMVLLSGFVIMSMKQTFHLVERDYYPKAIEYQNRIDKTHNAEKLTARIEVENQGNEILLTFPRDIKPGLIKGEIVFYRPSDVGKDVVYPIEVDTNGVQVCDVSKLPKGKYILKIDYHDGNIGYYQEESVLVKM